MPHHFRIRTPALPLRRAATALLATGLSAVAALLLALAAHRTGVQPWDPGDLAGVGRALLLRMLQGADEPFAAVAALSALGVGAVVMGVRGPGPRRGAGRPRKDRSARTTLTACRSRT